MTHGNSDRVFQTGREASFGVQAVAENGMPGELAGEWNDLGLANTVALPAEGPGPIFGGDSRTFEFSSDDSRFSLVTMLICTNDGFGGVDTRRLPNRVGQTTNHTIRAYDAGTEINTQMDADLVPVPFCGDPEIGDGATNPALAEDGVVRPHRGIRRNVGDIPQMYDFSRIVGRVTVERIS